MDVSNLCAALGMRSVDKRYDAVEAARGAVLELRDTLCEHLPIERNELVLVSILQTLQLFDVDEQALEAISKLASEDRRPLVRAYAIYALAGRAGSTDAGFFVSRLLKERNPRVRIEALLALYRAGCRGVIGEIVKLVKSSDYHTQCAAINGLLALDIEQDQESVVKMLRWLARSDAPRAVVSTAKAALDALEG